MNGPLGDDQRPVEMVDSGGPRWWTLFRFRHVWILFFPLGMLLQALAGGFPGVVEGLYSRGLYPVLAQALGSLTGLLPFSLAELMATLLITALAVALVRAAVRLVRRSQVGVPVLRRKSGPWALLKKKAQQGLSWAAVLYFLFLLLWGLNYSRLSWAETHGLEVGRSSVEDLLTLAEELIASAGELRRLARAEPVGGGEEWPGSLARRVQSGFEALNESAEIPSGSKAAWTGLEGAYPAAKAVLSGWAFDATGIGGIYFPFTAEAQFNPGLPDLLLPATIAHEMAHQRGWAREDEANFIAFLVCRAHPDGDFRYSGVFTALLSVLGALLSEAPERRTWLVAHMTPGVRADWLEVTRYYRRWSGLVSQAAQAVNHAYLQANRQEGGLRSYGRVVDLLLADFKSRKPILPY